MNQVIQKVSIFRGKSYIVLLFLLALASFVQCKQDKFENTASIANQKLLVGEWQLHSLGNITPSFGYVFEIENKTVGKIEDEGIYIPFNYRVDSTKISFISEDERSKHFPFMDGEIFYYEFIKNNTIVFLELQDKNNKEVAKYVKL